MSNASATRRPFASAGILNVRPYHARSARMRARSAGWSSNHGARGVCGANERDTPTRHTSGTRSHDQLSSGPGTKPSPSPSSEGRQRQYPFIDHLARVGVAADHAPSSDSASAGTPSGIGALPGLSTLFLIIVMDTSRKRTSPPVERLQREMESLAALEGMR